MTLHDLLRCPLGWPMCPMATFLVVTCSSSSSTHTAQLPKLGASARTALNMRANKAQRNRISWPYKQKRDATPETLVPGGYKPPNTNLQLISAIRIGRRGHHLPRNTANFRSRSDALQMASSHNELRGKQLGTSSTWMGAPRSNQSQAFQIC